MGNLASCRDNFRFSDDDDSALAVRVSYVPTVSDETLGAITSGYVVGQELWMRTLGTPDGFLPLVERSRSDSGLFPDSYPFRATRRWWRVDMYSDAEPRQRWCALQLNGKLKDRCLENAQYDIQDACDAATYAHRFNLAQQQHFRATGEQCSGVQVAIPVACEVIRSRYPAMVPVGSVCCVIPYASPDVQKFVFEGHEDFFEVPHAYFHYAAFSSNSKHFVCDIQGCADDDGNFLFLDPCLLRSEPLSLGGIVGAALAAKKSTEGYAGDGLTCGVAALDGSAASSAPTSERFNAMHPRCSELCRSFDPLRKSCGKRTIGICGTMPTCGLGA